MSKSDQVDLPSGEWMYQTATSIERCLKGFNLRTRVCDIEFRNGSTLFMCDCAEGVSLSTIKSHALDLARMVRSVTGKVELVIPIPGTHYFGVVVPYTKDSEKTVDQPQTETSPQNEETLEPEQSERLEVDEARSIRRRLAEILYGLANRIDDTPDY
jgi:DNA segregation ATPase FtsK/SpoIIIE-like protein